ncbi:MAG: hypothetical protein P8R42_28265 [Candidatus Binatia bacterium]|nr:hypothetical protein [Candidatus Binatia bacterium]
MAPGRPVPYQLSLDETTQTRAARAIALLVIGIGVLVACSGLERLNTWYLASDQYAFLTLAEDLRDGRLTRTDPLYDFMPEWKKGSFDALSQTYHFRQGTLHSRYPPGFSAMLAVAGAAFGERGQHGLNPLLYLIVFAVLARLSYVVLKEVDVVVAYGASAAVVWLLLLLPTDVHLWGITVARDLPAHLFGLLALWAAVGRRFGLAGFALGVSCIVRPDSALYVVSLGAVALVRGGVLAAAAWGAVGFVLGSWPLFAYNWAVLGHPFSFTQGSEFTWFFAALSPFASVAHAANFVVPAGGGFRAVHFSRTMAGNLELLAGSFGWFALPALVAVGWGLVRARVLVAAFVPYAIVATIFYGFWGHPDPRYLAGVSLCLMSLVVAGVVVACRRAADPASSTLWRVGALLVLAAVVLRTSFDVTLLDLPMPTRSVVALSILTGLCALLALRNSLTDRLRLLAPMGVPVLLMVLALVEVLGGTGRRDPYSREQVARAKGAVEAVMPAGSIVITSPALGRPAENITHYTGVRAVYATELAMFGVHPGHAPLFHKLRGRRVFFLLPPRVTSAVAAMPPTLRTKVVRRIPPNAGLDWFLNPRKARGGAVLHEVEFADSFLPFVEAYRSREDASPPQE